MPGQSVSSERLESIPHLQKRHVGHPVRSENRESKIGIERPAREMLIGESDIVDCQIDFVLHCIDIVPGLIDFVA